MSITKTQPCLDYSVTPHAQFKKSLPRELFLPFSRGAAASLQPASTSPKLHLHNLSPKVEWPFKDTEQLWNSSPCGPMEQGEFSQVTPDSNPHLLLAALLTLSLLCTLSLLLTLTPAHETSLVRPRGRTQSQPYLSPAPLILLCPAFITKITILIAHDIPGKV